MYVQILYCMLKSTDYQQPTHFAFVISIHTDGEKAPWSWEYFPFPSISFLAYALCPPSLKNWVGVSGHSFSRCWAISAWLWQAFILFLCLWMSCAAIASWRAKTSPLSTLSCKFPNGSGECQHVSRIELSFTRCPLMHLNIWMALNTETTALTNIICFATWQYKRLINFIKLHLYISQCLGSLLDFRSSLLAPRFFCACLLFRGDSQLSDLDRIRAHYSHARLSGNTWHE